MPKLTEWVIKQATIDVEKAGGKYIAINIPSSIESSCLRKLLVDLHPLIRLEVTERHSFSPEFLAFLSHLADSGIEIMLDDFGTEYSTILILLKLKWAAIKIAQEFTSNLEIVELIAKFQRLINAPAILEGIESEQLVEKALQIGIRYGQGHALGRPQPITYNWEEYNANNYC